MKLKNGEWAIENIAPSEKAVPYKFNVSRVTVINALRIFVSIGILSAKRYVI